MGLRGNDAENNEPRATGSRLLERQPGVTVSDQLGLVGFRAGVSCCPGRADVWVAIVWQFVSSQLARILAECLRCLSQRGVVNLDARNYVELRTLEHYRQ